MFIWAFLWSFAVFFLHLSYTVLLISRHFIFCLCDGICVPIILPNCLYMKMTEFLYIHFVA